MQEKDPLVLCNRRNGQDHVPSIQTTCILGKAFQNDELEILERYKKSTISPLACVNTSPNEVESP